MASGETSSSPPRRMTRARAKKEGYEPDWRINPHWKTPRKQRVKTARNGIPDNEKDDSIIAGRNIDRTGSNLAPSPVKIRIAAKLPLKAQVEKSSPLGPLTPVTIPSSSAVESPRKSVNLGSPVRVPPRNKVKPNNSADKENSQSVAMPNAWDGSKKSTVPKTPIGTSCTKPLETSPASVNTQPQPTTVKVLSTPVRILNPQTPRRTLGSAKRIPVRVEKTRPTAYKLDPISDNSCPESHRDFSYRVDPRHTSPTKLTSRDKVILSPIKAQQTEAKNHESKSTTLPCILQVSDPTDSVQVRPAQPTEWVALNKVPTLQRPSFKPPNPPQRPSKTSLKEIPTCSVSKRNFCVDESVPIPQQTELKLVQRTSPVPRFPIHRRSLSSPLSPEKVTSKPRVASNPVHFNSLEELRPATKTEKWKTPVKRQIHGPVQSVRKVCFRTPSMEVASKEAKASPTLRKPSSILSLATTKAVDEKESSTTLSDTPRSHSSPKVFDLSDVDNSFDLFTPRKPKVPVTPKMEKHKNVYFNSSSAKNQLSNPVELAAFIPRSSKTQPVMQAPSPHDPVQIHDVPNVPKGPQVILDHKDISVPIKDADLTTPIIISKSPSANLSAKSARSEKEGKGPLQGVVAFVDVRTADGDDAGAPFAEILRNLGARVVKQWTWNGEELDKVGITHVIFKEGGPRTLSRVKCTKGTVKCVGLGWISRCDAEKVKADETPFQVEIPAGQYGHKRRKSMEPRALISANTTPFKDQKDKDDPDDKVQRALSELSLNKDLDCRTPPQSTSLQLARRKSLQHAPVVSSPLARNSWTVRRPQFNE